MRKLRKSDIGKTLKINITNEGDLPFVAIIAELTSGTVTLTINGEQGKFCRSYITVIN